MYNLAVVDNDEVSAETLAIGPPQGLAEAGLVVTSKDLEEYESGLAAVNDALGYFFDE